MKILSPLHAELRVTRLAHTAIARPLDAPPPRPPPATGAAGADDSR